MKKQALAMLLGTALVFGTLAGCGGSEESKEQPATEDAAESEDSQDAQKTDESKEGEEKGQLMMATTTSTADTGLLDYLAPIFQEDTGYELLWDAVGTGEALKMGEN